MKWFLPLLTIVGLTARFCAAEELAVEARELPQFPPLESAEALKAFVVKPGFHLELVAAEPLVTDPIAATWDENGRMFVVEMNDYSEQREVTPHLGRIRMLEDLDGDGQYEKSTVWATDLAWPSGLIWANGGLWVASSPEVLFLQDADGDGRAEKREVVYTGFGSAVPVRNVQSLPNSFCWGPDNRIHLQCGGQNSGEIRCAKKPELPPLKFTGQDLVFDPRTLEFAAEPGGGQYGMCFDDWGNRFACNNSDHLRMYRWTDLPSSPYFALPPALASIAADGPAAEVFRISPDEPWRVIRTRWRASGRVKGVVEGGGRVSGYFTGATGTTVYRGDAYGPEFLGNTFTGDAGGNLVHRKVLRAEGLSMVGERPADERKREFIASRDTWFRPVKFENAPDGTLYIMDMYREVIEHPASIPPQIKEKLDLTSGRDRGRIWRIAPDGWKPRPGPQLGKMSSEELVQTLGHPNGWHRDTATRLLVERGAVLDMKRLLEAMVEHGPTPQARLHALRMLETVGVVNKQALEDADERVRKVAVAALWRSVAWLGTLPAVETLKEWSAAETAPQLLVSWALFWGHFAQDPQRQLVAREALALLSRHAVKDSLTLAAVLVAAGEQGESIFEELIGEPQAVPFPQLMEMAGYLGLKAHTHLFTALQNWGHPAAEFQVLAEVAAKLTQRGVPLEAAGGQAALTPTLESAREVLATEQAPALDRSLAADLLCFGESVAWELALRQGLGNADDRIAASCLEALLNRAKLQQPETLLMSWPKWPTRLRERAAQAAVRSAGLTPVFLQLVEAGTIPAAEVGPVEVAALCGSHTAAVAARAKRLWPGSAMSREEVAQGLQAALSLKGDKAAGMCFPAAVYRVPPAARGGGMRLGRIWKAW